MASGRHDSDPLLQSSIHWDRYSTHTSLHGARTAAPVFTPVALPLVPRSGQISGVLYSVRSFLMDDEAVTIENVKSTCQEIPIVRFIGCGPLHRMTICCFMRMNSSIRLTTLSDTTLLVSEAKISLVDALLGYLFTSIRSSP